MGLQEKSQLESSPALINEDIHFQELKRRIGSIQRECAAKGWLGGPYLQMLCDELLEDLEKYITKLYNKFLNKVKIENLYKSSSPEAISNIFNNHSQNLFKKYLDIIEHESTVTVPCSTNLVKSLSFIDRFNNKLENLSVEFKAKFAENLRQMINEEARLETEKSSLKTAIHANEIAKESKKASWILGIISNLIALAAFVVAYLAYKK